MRDVHARADGGRGSEAIGRTLAGVHLALASQRGVPPGESLVDELAGGAPPVPPGEVEPPGGLATPDLLGAVYECLRDERHRKSSGAVYTDAAMATRVVDWALARRLRVPTVDDVTVCDPAVGGGVFLLAAADALVARGMERSCAVERLFGADIDAVAVAVARAALTLWAGDGRGPAAHALLVADGLALAPSDWPSGPADGFAVVVGNPPFRGQLQALTARGSDEHALTKARFGGAAATYVDTAALFLVQSCRLARVGGVVALLQPESFLAARDAGPSRSLLLDEAVLRGMWLAGGGLFDGGVRVCIPLLEVGRRPGKVELRSGHEGVDAGWVEAPTAETATWGYLAAEVAGVPAVRLDAARSLASLCQATADFRDEYYGLLPALVDGDARDRCGRSSAQPPVVTCGTVEPAVSRWGERPTRLGRRAFAAPRADLAILGDSGRGEWARKRLVPKVLVATQTRVIEAVVDERGEWLPSTPVITVTCPPGRLWHVAAALLSPVATAWALRNYRGVALSADTVKLSARQVLQIPAPAEGDAWDEAAAAVQRAARSSGDAWRQALVEAAAASCRAYGVEEHGLVDWWADRLPAWR